MSSSAQFHISRSFYPHSFALSRLKMLAEAAKIGYTIGEKYAKATNSGGCAMIHDIEPKHLYNEWKPNAVPKRSSAVVQFCGRNLLCRIDDNGLKLPR